MTVPGATFVSMSIVLTLLTVFALVVLIVVHEGGHYLVARWTGMRVDRFSVGFGPVLWSKQRGETLYQVALIPLGGFVQIAGLNEEGDKAAVDKDGKQVEGMRENDPRAFPNRPIWQRIATIFAGPATNYIFAAVVMTALYLIAGIPQGKQPLVGGLVEGKPAAKAGLLPGDEIRKINGTTLNLYTEVAPAIAASQGKPLDIVVFRDGAEKTLSVVPEKDGNDYRIGIEVGAKEEFVSSSLTECVRNGVMFPIAYSREILHGFAEIFRGHQKAQFSGPLGIMKVMKHQMALGPKSGFSIAAIISVYLGLFNLLPIPALDGGRIVFLLAEAVSRRRVNQRIEQTVHMVGMLVLLGFMVFVTLGNDLGLAKLFKH